MMYLIKLALLAILLLTSALGVADDLGRNLVSGCAISQLKECKLQSIVIKSDTTSKFNKLFNCLKYGSATGDSFDLGIPLPEGAGEIGFGFGTTSENSTETCKEEVAKLNNASYLKSFSETFDEACGKTLSGQYSACLESVIKLKEVKSPQNFQCVATQSANSILISTLYNVAEGENSDAWKIKSISGLDGLQCEDNVRAGVSRYTSFHCKLPSTYGDSSITLKLGNGVTCDVKVSPERKQEIESARRHSCGGLMSSIAEEIEPLKENSLLRIAAVGLCETCLSQNLQTGDSDQRNLGDRLTGCMTWAMTSLVRNGANLCSVVKAPAGMLSMPDFGSFLPTSLANPGQAVPPPVQPTAPGAMRSPGVFFLLSPEADPLAAQWNRSLCNGRKPGDILELSGDDWKRIPIDYLPPQNIKDPLLLKISESINRIQKSKSK